MTAPPPPKIKAFLASIKETYLDPTTESVNNDPTNNSKSLYRCVLRLELLHRGVLCEEDDDHGAIMNAIQNAAGKSLLMEPQLPKPLLAGLSVITGRVAEKMAAAAETTTSHPWIENSSAVRSVLRRVQDVNDVRFELLLSTTVSWYRLAEGYFLRATLFQPDAPPAWKKSWEALAHYTGKEASWQATTAVTHLIRIVSNKGNVKRGAELKLVLCDCHLDAVTVTNSSNVAVDPLDTVFCAPHRPVSPLPPQQAVSNAREALQTISDNKNLLDEEDQLYQCLLEWRVSMAQQEAELQTAARAELERRQNRKTAATFNAKTSTLEQCLISVRANLLQGDTTNIQTAGVALCERLCRMDASDSKHRNAVYTILKQHVEWLRDVARAKRNWRLAVPFVVPFLEYLGNKLGEQSFGEEELAVEFLQSLLYGETVVSNAAEISCMESVCCAASSIQWMCRGTESDPLIPLRSLLLARNLLAVCEQQRSAEKERKKQKSKSIGSSDSPEDLLIARLKAAVASVRAVLVLHISKENEEMILFAMTNEVVARGPVSVDLASEFGSAFYEFLCCWSGLHRIPWAFCTQPEARQLVSRARQCVDVANRDWGRSEVPIEKSLLALGGADTEGAAFEGGLHLEAQQGYHDAMSWAESLTAVASDLIISRCLSGIAALFLKKTIDTQIDAPAEMVRKGLERLRLIAEASSGSVGPWRSERFLDRAVKFQIASATQTLSRILLRDGKSDEATTVLQDAVKAAPLDPTASFALGSILLYNMFYGDERTPTIEKAAQVQLLRAAKLDSGQSDPFALLGFWYEARKDYKRAIGCYSKSLLLDSAQPVAGRGIIRLAPRETLQKVYEEAIASSSALNGWAWRGMALQKAMDDGEDDSGVVALLKAVRCRDIERPENETLGPFFSDPQRPVLPSRMSLADTYFDLGACYRRLGRYTAAIRSFQVAMEVAGDTAPTAYLCSCAQVELELGLLEDAESKFRQASVFKDSNEDLAVYGRSSSLLQMAQRSHQDGKEGLAYALLREGVSGCESSGNAAMCFQKLLGDLYSFGANLPPDVFGSGSNDSQNMETRIAFVSKGEEAYRRAMQRIGGKEEENNVVRAGLLSDAGSNLLLRGRLLSHSQNSVVLQSPSTDSLDICKKAADDFRSAIKICGTFSPAWCGLGCSVLHSEPLLAQHAFSRAIELEAQSPDALANLSFLYTQNKKFLASAKVSNALTEVADTPMMWLNRALILEDETSSERDMRMSCDAYRAALQVVRDPTATLGVSLTCRASGENDLSTVIDSYLYSAEYLAMSGGTDFPAVIAHSIQQVEYGQMNITKHSGSLVSEGKSRALLAMKELEKERPDKDSWGPQVIRDALNESPLHEKKESDPWNLDRQIVHNPASGELWLQYSKSRLPSTWPALVAARKAEKIMNEKLSRAPINSTHLSESLVLKYWLESLEDQERSNPVDLQRALLMNPGNPLAREAIRGAVGYT